MVSKRKIEVTPNLKRCVKELRTAVASLPEGNPKTKAEAALDHLARAFEGGPRLKLEAKCPINTTVIKS